MAYLWNQCKFAKNWSLKIICDKKLLVFFRQFNTKYQISFKNFNRLYQVVERKKDN
uniref:Uncharacterized protein n=1 Tax=Octopus bimaculoides TaxID=37653 RepID=A0A0L8FT53_OCTBM